MVMLNNKSVRVVLGSFVLAGCSMQSGCAVAAIGAGIGAVKYANAEKREQYREYRVDTEKINLQREMAGLEPVKILTYEEGNEGKQ